MENQKFQKINTHQKKHRRAPINKSRRRRPQIGGGGADSTSKCMKIGRTKTGQGGKIEVEGTSSLEEGEAVWLAFSPARLTIPYYQNQNLRLGPI